MSNPILVPACEIRQEIVINHSRFIAILSPIDTAENAKLFIQRIRNEFPDASHCVPAYLIGYPPSEISHCSDAGEPPGTAGRPILAVLRGSGMGDVVVVVVRYFGGKKLGKGGLVRAYTEAVKKTVELVPKARLVAYRVYRLEIPYALFQKVSRVIEQISGTIIEKKFVEVALLTVQVESQFGDEFVQQIHGISAGKLTPDLLEEITVPKPV